MEKRKKLYSTEGKYILDGHKVVPEHDLLKWADWFENAKNRIVAKTQILTSGAAPVEVSTVFLGLDHNWGSGAPLLFETLVFGGPLDGEMNRYSTWEEAEKGHTAMVARVKAKDAKSTK